MTQPPDNWELCRSMIRKGLPRDARFGTSSIPATKTFEVFIEQMPIPLGIIHWRYSFDKGAVEILNIQVIDAVQKAGLGTWLLEQFIETWKGDAQVERIVTQVVREPARKLFVSHGFEFKGKFWELRIKPDLAKLAKELTFGLKVPSEVLAQMEEPGIIKPLKDGEAPPL
ncbi:MAG: GNAT family N-acetyltransferase [Bdellovibrionota bacterium]